MTKFAAFLGVLAMGMLALTTNVFSDEVAPAKAQASSATAETAEVAQRPAFEQLDQNHDGKISLAEAKGSWLASSFAEVDTNQDGFVNQDEYKHAIS